jgi:hypothetical protein
MKKLLVVLVLMSWTFHMFSDVQSFEVNFDDVELEFENIYLKDVEFCKGNEIIIKTHDFSDLDIVQNAYKMTISADEETKISIELPITKRYQYMCDDGICKFDCETLNFDGDDVFVIISSDGIKVNEYDGSEVVINDEGIYVKDDNEIVKINEDGITIEGDDDFKLHGLFGTILGSFVRGVVNTAFTSIGRSPDKVFKHIVNDEDNEITTVHFGWE